MWSVLPPPSIPPRADAHRRFVGKLAGLLPVLSDGYRRERRTTSARQGIKCRSWKPPASIFLQPSSPEMNAIEPHWRQSKYQALPERSENTAQALKAAVAEALTKRAKQLGA